MPLMPHAIAIAPMPPRHIDCRYLFCHAIFLRYFSDTLRYYYYAFIMPPPMPLDAAFTLTLSFAIIFSSFADYHYRHFSRLLHATARLFHIFL